MKWMCLSRADFTLLVSAILTFLYALHFGRVLPLLITIFYKNLSCVPLNQVVYQVPWRLFEVIYLGGRREQLCHWLILIPLKILKQLEKIPSNNKRPKSLKYTCFMESDFSSARS